MQPPSNPHAPPPLAPAASLASLADAPRVRYASRCRDADMRGVDLRGATLDGADFRDATFVPAEPSKPSAAPAQPPSAAESQPASAQELMQALTTALSAQQPSQPTDLKPADLRGLKSAKGADFTGATMTRVNFDRSNLAGATFDTSDVSSASMVDVIFGQYRMPAKLEAKKQAKAAVRRLTMQLGKATVAAAMEAAGDEEDNDDDDDADQKEDSAEAQASWHRWPKRLWSAMHQWWPMWCRR